jgi:hypothetical protein
LHSIERELTGAFSRLPWQAITSWLFTHRYDLGRQIDMKSTGYRALTALLTAALAAIGGKAAAMSAPSTAPSTVDARVAAIRAKAAELVGADARAADADTRTRVADDWRKWRND